MFLLLLSAFASLNSRLLDTFKIQVNIHQALQSILSNSTVTDYKFKSKDKSSFWQFGKSKCKESCILSITTKLQLSKKYSCSIAYLFTISTRKDQYTQDESVSDCVLVNEQQLPMKIGFAKGNNVSATEIIETYHNISRVHEEFAVRNHLHLSMRQATTFPRFRFEKAFELQDGSGFILMLMETPLICYDGFFTRSCSSGVDADVIQNSVLVMKYVPSFFSNSILYVIVERGDTGYVLKMYFIKGDYLESNRKVYFRSVSCSHSVTCFTKLNMGFSKLVDISEMK